MRSTPGDRGTSGLYDAVVNYGCLEILEDHFETEGMVLHHNTAEQWAGLLPDAEFVDAMPDERLTGDETLVLLLLSLAWNEGVSEANIGHRGVVETTANAILSRLFDITRKQERISRRGSKTSSGDLRAARSSRSAKRIPPRSTMSSRCGR